VASNSFGEILRFTTFGESHGVAIGVVIDGVPAGLALDESHIAAKLQKRRGGQSALVTERKEEDIPQILSGVFEGRTTGAPIAILIQNKDVRSESYEPIKNVLRPGHANFSYLEKYGIFDYRGGGRASARETASRVAAGAVASKILEHYDIKITSYIKGEIAVDEGDSIGGIVETCVEGVPAGLGDPVYQKMEARLAFGMLSIPACKGFEIGSGFAGAMMRGSEHNDEFFMDGTEVRTRTNHAGGTLGGITTGMPIVFRAAFKPTSSIKKAMKTVTVDGKQAEMVYPEGSRHDPCVAIRAVPVVEAMTALVLADLVLLARCSKI